MSRNLPDRRTPPPPPPPPRRLSERVGSFFHPFPDRAAASSVADENPAAPPPPSHSRHPTYRPSHDYPPATAMVTPSVAEWAPSPARPAGSNPFPGAYTPFPGAYNAPGQPPLVEPQQRQPSRSQVVAEPAIVNSTSHERQAQVKLDATRSPSPIDEATGELFFEGKSGTECELFIRSVKKKAFTEGKQRDDEWMADVASVAFIGQALRWLETLDDDTQSSWKLLRQALLTKYPASQDGTSEYQSTSDFTRGITAPRPLLGSLAQLQTLGSRNPFIPTPAVAITRSSPSYAPPPAPPQSFLASMTNPAVPPPENRGRPPFGIGTDLALLKLRESSTWFWVRVECSDQSADGYVSSAVAAKTPTSSTFGFHTVVPRLSRRLLVIRTVADNGKDPNKTGRIGINLRDSEYLGLTWLERNPNNLTRGNGQSAYAHLTTVREDRYGQWETSYRVEDDTSCDSDSDINISGGEIWKVDYDGFLTPSWQDYNGKSHDLDVAVCLHDKEINLVADYNEFVKLYGPAAFRKVRLRLEATHEQVYNRRFHPGSVAL